MPTSNISGPAHLAGRLRCTGLNREANAGNLQQHASTRVAQVVRDLQDFNRSDWTNCSAGTASCVSDTYPPHVLMCRSSAVSQLVQSRNNSVDPFRFTASALQANKPSLLGLGLLDGRWDPRRSLPIMSLPGFHLRVSWNWARRGAA